MGWVDEGGAEPAAVDQTGADRADADRAAADHGGTEPDHAAEETPAGRRSADAPRRAAAPEPAGDSSQEVTSLAPRDEAEPADVDDEEDDDTREQPIVADSDEVTARRMAPGRARPVPARRNLRLVVGLIALVASVALPLTLIGGPLARTAPSGAALPLSPATPTPSATPSPTPTNRLPPEQQAQQVILDAEPAPVPGIAQPCSTDFVYDTDQSPEQNVSRMEELWDLTLSGRQWSDPQYRDGVLVFASTLDAVDCTAYLDKVRAGNGGRLEVSSEPPRTSWAWGDYGLTRPNIVTLDMSKFQQGWEEGQRGRMARLTIHEFAHAVNSDRFENPPYWQRTTELFTTVGPISDYGSTDTETFADAVGYYVARCAKDNPYLDTKFQPYYDLVRTEVFDGVEFGTAVGETQVCTGEEG